MPWTSVKVDMDADKAGNTQPNAATVTATFIYPDSTPFVYSERLDKNTPGSFATRAHNAKLAYDVLYTKQNTMAGNFLIALQGLDP